MEITMSNWLQLIITLSSLAAVFGGLKQHIINQAANIDKLEKKIDKLEEKQDKHNDFMRRMASVEVSVGANTATCAEITRHLHGIEKEVVKIGENVKSNQHRIDELEHPEQ